MQTNQLPRTLPEEVICELHPYIKVLKMMYQLPSGEHTYKSSGLGGNNALGHNYVHEGKQR